MKKFYLPFYLVLCLLITNVQAQNYLIQDWVQTSGIPDTLDWSASIVDGSGNIYVTSNTISATEKANILTIKPVAVLSVFMTMYTHLQENMIVKDF